MSKTASNVVDPRDLMNRMGTDALRFTLLTGGTPGNDMNLALAKVEGNRNFANKIWNAARFIVHNLTKVSAADAPTNGSERAYTAADRWILTRLNDTITTANRLLDGYQFGEAGRQVYDFFWGDFADWYVEMAKVQLAESGARAWLTLSVLHHVMDQCLRLLHPYIPFVTEETWQQMKSAFKSAAVGIEPAEGWSEALIIAGWPEPGRRYSESAAAFETVRDLVREIRGVRAEKGIEPGRRIPAHIAAGSRLAFLASQQPLLAALARLDEAQLVIAERVEAPDTAVTLALGEITAYLPLAGTVDLAQEKERLQTELAEAENQIRRLSGLLAGPFAERAPAAVVQKEQEKLAAYEAEATQLRQRLAAL
jgi:valyl-tRNA synthetase